eukprot:Gb_07631 [translate_table: standard]
MVLNCCMQILQRVVNPLRLSLAPLCLCLTAAADDDSAIDVDPPRLSSDDGSRTVADPPRLPSDEVAQTSISTQNDQNADYTQPPPVANFDVFINHRGVVVKDNLASHIYDLLQFHGVRAFLDREELRPGEDFPDAIMEAIRSSSVHIAIFSPHYAESDWCLRELALMLKIPNSTIIPVFYNVTPAEVQWENSAFVEPFGKHYRRHSREMVDEWKAALKEVSYISSLSLSDLKGRLARAIVEEVLKIIKSEPLTVAKFPVGLEEPVAKLREYITRCRMEKKHVAFVGIIGIAGIGKTTLSKALFNNICWDLNFKRALYIEDIKGEAEKNGLQEIQRKLLHSLLHYDYKVSNMSQGQHIIKKRLSNIDAIIVLDNIEDKKQLDAILSPEILLPGSTVIVTSRDSSIFKRCNDFFNYEMSGLSVSHSKELFCRHAFRCGVACASFRNMVDKFVGICKGIPLALEVCGGELYGESYAIWVSYSKKFSETMLVDLKRILQVSYARLDEKQKEIFLDIAIFFHGRNVHTIERIWEENSENSFKYDLVMLEPKCIIKMSGNAVTMHDAFRDLGKAIVDEESPTSPRGRSLLWRPKDVKKVLESFKNGNNRMGMKE